MITHHIHVVKYPGSNWENYLNFRDFLNAFPQKAQEYDLYKQRLAKQFPNDRRSYTKGKQKLVAKILIEAQKWKETLRDRV